MKQQCARNAQRRIASMMLAMLVFATGLMTFASHAFAVAPPSIIAYQGRLLNANGVPVSDSTASISFAFYTASSGGTCVWSNNSDSCASVVARTVTLTDGLFSENLGDTAAATPYAVITDPVLANNATLYLEVIVNGETLSPRKRLLASPFAVSASLLDGFDTSQSGGISAFVTVLDANGNLQLTGSPQGSGIGQGSLYINPASGVVAADEILFGVAVSGTRKLSVDGEGDTAVGGDIMVGGSTLVAPFSVDESTNTVRIGDGANDANTPTLTFYASDGSNYGSLTYTDNDTFAFGGGNVNVTGLGIMTTLASGVTRDFYESSSFLTTSNASLGTIEMYGMGAETTYSGVENAVGTDHIVGAEDNVLTVSGASTTLTKGFASRNRLLNTSTNASLVQGVGYLSTIESEFTQNAAATTLADAYSVHATVQSNLGTLTSGSAVFGEVAGGGGTLTTGYAGKFSAVTSGTNRYGLYAEASGGTTNYSGYFTGAQVQIDADTTPDTPTNATASGDLYVGGTVEGHGSAYFGDTSGTDAFSFTSAATATDALSLTTNSVTSGVALHISRAAGGGDFDGNLLKIDQQNSSGTSDGNALSIVNQGAGNSVALRILQNSLSAHSANATGNNALVIDTNDAPNNDDLMVIRSDVDGSADTEFRIQSNGDVFGDGATYNSGADYAEFFKTRDAALDDYQVVCQDPGYAEGVRRCPAGDTTYVMGVISTNAAFVGNNLRGASDNLDNDTSYRKVGMVGQIDTLVNAAEGAIAVGDAISTSMTMAGYGAKAHGPARIVGFALESLASGTGTIRVLVQPQWYGGDVLTSDGTSMVASTNVVAAPLHTATATSSGDSHDIVLRGSGWSTGAAVTKSMTLRNDVTDASSSYHLSVVSDTGAEVASIGETGDLAIAGKLYPSDRGTLQASKYIYYDGSTGAGGDFMRTNASGWGSGSYDFAEMFPSPDMLAPGEVVVFANGKEQIARSTGVTYDDRIAGVVSTRPGFLAGDNKAGDVPVALAGRVPTYVSGENGAIAIGDPLTTSSKAGYAMKATKPGPIVGYAMEAFSGTTGVVTTFIRPSYFDGAENDAPLAENTVTDVTSVAKLDVSGSMNMNGGSILSVASLSGIGNNWRMDENGNFVTHGGITALIASYNGEDVPTYPSLGRQHTIELSGTAQLQGGAAHIDFEKIDPAFNDIIANNAPYRVLVTPAGVTGVVYATERTANGFVIRDSANTDGVAVDWLVIAYQKDFAPDVKVEDVLTPEEPSLESDAPSNDGGTSSEISDVIEDTDPVTETVSSDATPAVVDDTVVPDVSAVEDAVAEPVTTSDNTTSASDVTETSDVPVAP